MSAITKSRAVSFRLDSDLQPTVKKWLSKNPSMSMSRLANMAIRGFVLKNQVLEGVQTARASKKEVTTSLKRLMKKHKKNFG